MGQQGGSFDSFPLSMRTGMAREYELVILCVSRLFRPATYLKHADLDVHWKGVELHGADEGDPGGERVHQLRQERTFKSFNPVIINCLFVLAQ